jgi:hypothetical protein
VHVSYGQTLSHVMAEAAEGAVGRYAGGVLPDRIDARAPGPSSGRAQHGHNPNGRMDCEGEPARVAGCTTKSGGQICGDAVADG